MLICRNAEGVHGLESLGTPDSVKLAFLFNVAVSLRTSLFVQRRC